MGVESVLYCWEGGGGSGNRCDIKYNPGSQVSVTDLCISDSKTLHRLTTQCDRIVLVWGI